MATSPAAQSSSITNCALDHVGRLQISTHSGLRKAAIPIDSATGRIAVETYGIQGDAAMLTANLLLYIMHLSGNLVNHSDILSSEDIQESRSRHYPVWLKACSQYNVL